MKYTCYIILTLSLILSLSANDLSSDENAPWPYIKDRMGFFPEQFYRRSPQPLRSKKRDIQSVELNVIVLTVLAAPEDLSADTTVYQGVIFYVDRIHKGKVDNDAIIVYCPLTAAGSHCEVDDDGNPIISSKLFKKGNRLRIVAEQMPNNDYILQSFSSL